MDVQLGTPLKYWLAVLSVAVGTFSIVTSQLLPVGLVPQIAAELGVSEGTVGLTLTVPGLVAAVAAPALTVAASGLDRRLVLTGLSALLVGANLVSAIATDFTVLLAARILVGLSVGGFWAIAGGIAVRLVPERVVGRATATIFAGVSTATVAGVPAGKLLGDLTDWRTAFAVVGVVALAVLAAQLVLLPRLPAGRATKLGDLLSLFRHPEIRVSFVAVFLLVIGHFSAYTFITPILREVGGVPPALATALLLAYGGAGFAGNFLGGTAAYRNPRRTLVVAAGGLGISLLLCGIAGGSLPLLVVLLLVWGAAYGAVPVSLQIWLGSAVPDRREVAGSLFVTAFQVSISVGALSGGLWVDSFGTAGVLLFGGTLTALTAAGLLVLRRKSAVD
ncbi:MFS transporter [Amycolatopsis albispora]|uniref:Transporter n=1 Tax=Amycolatopsis albispora TaxID=1804986 RepID=A0A344LBU4_9PSEU|nr:MFS transporter [Amycolatopsis albispora]AXB45518.1 transporter [Amycolatopsis albispora]